MSEIFVTKRDGSKTPLNIDKIHDVVEFACDGLSGVSPSEVEVKSHIQFSNGIKTSDIQETLIKSASELISEESPNYQFVAGRLINFHLRKLVYGQFDPPELIEHYKKLVLLGWYDQALYNKYSKNEWETLNSVINHSLDFNLTYAAMEQFRGKYLVQNRVTNEIFETPQMLYMLVSMTLFAEYPEESRIGYVKKYYNHISKGNISLPTPILAGVRTPDRQFSSCVLIEAADSLNSISATNAAIIRYVSQKAGIGVGAGSIRASGSPIRNGQASHTGVIPFYRTFQSSVKSCSQGGVRGGAATLYYPLWHLEVEDLLVLKNNKGIDSNRLRQMDYGVQFNKLMYERLIKGEHITLFSPSDVPGLYESFFNDQDKFKEIYEKAERNTKIRKRKVSAVDLFSSFMQERKDTGRIYLQNVDNANIQGSFDEAIAPIRQSNLCVTGDTELDIIVDGQGMFNVPIIDVIGYICSGRVVKVSSYNIETNTFQYAQASKGAMTGKDRELMEIEDDATGKKVICTPEHQIYTKNRGYVEARNLVETDELKYVKSVAHREKLKNANIGKNWYSNDNLKTSCQANSPPGNDWYKGRIYGY
jgi:ribonucleoside-diphosphate reductase alpha chain